VGDTNTILSASFDNAINAVDCTIIGIVRAPAKEYHKVYVKMNLAHLQRLLDTEKIEHMVLLLADPFSSERRPVHVTPCRLHTTDIQLTHDPTGTGSPRGSSR